MSVEQAFIEQWGRYKPLVDLVPESSVWKGKVPQAGIDEEPTEKPYVSFLAEDPESTRTSDNLYTTANLRMEVYAETGTQAERIATEAKEYYDGIGADWSRGSILDCKCNGVTQEDEDGEWFVLVQFAVTVQEARKLAAFR